MFRDNISENNLNCENVGTGNMYMICIMLCHNQKDIKLLGQERLVRNEEPVFLEYKAQFFLIVLP